RRHEPVVTGTDRARQAAGIVPAEDAPVRPRKPETVYEFIQALGPELAKAAPEGMNIARLARVATTTVRRSEIPARKSGGRSLADCDPLSFAGAFLTATALGLHVDLMGESYLVPKKRECVLIIGWQGYQKLYWQHPLAYGLAHGYLCQNDGWEYRLGAH